MEVNKSSHDTINYLPDTEIDVSADQLDAAIAVVRQIGAEGWKKLQMDHDASLRQPRRVPREQSLRLYRSRLCRSPKHRGNQTQ